MINKKESIKKLLNPKSVAVIGANDKNSYAGRFIRNIQNNGYKGILYGVNPKRDEVLGIQCYGSIKDVPEKIDLAVVIINARYVEDVVKECVDADVGSILIITAGFSEVDNTIGKEKERNIKKIASEKGIRVLGPNCIGFANVLNNFWGCTISTLGIDPLNSGNAALVSQSGAAGFGSLLTSAKDRNIGFKYIVTTGNEADLGVIEIVDIMLDDEDIKSIAMLIEGIKDIDNFIKIIKKAKKKDKSLSVLKIGESEVGSRAAASHTASMTGDIEVFNSLIRQYGILKADDYNELVELVKMTQMKHQLKGKRFAVVSHSGGLSSFSGDQLGKYNLEVPEFRETTKNEINKYLNNFGSPSNPLDLTASHMRSEVLFKVIDIVERNEKIDAYLFVTCGSTKQMKNPIKVAQNLNKPVYFIWSSSFYDEGLSALKDTEIPVSFSISTFAKLAERVYTANNKKIEEDEYFEKFKDIEFEVSGKYLDENESKMILKNQDIRVPESKVIKDLSDLKEVKFPNIYVMKILSEKIIHKSDIGGVKLNIKDKNDLYTAFNDLNKVNDRYKDEINGFYLEEMSKDGLDIVLGTREDKQFGWIVMLGIGGITTELFKLSTIRLLPLGKNEINEMIDEILGLKEILAGYRGEKAYDREALIDAIYKLAGLVYKNRNKLELVEINPLRVMNKDEGVIALDCVIKLK